MAVNALEIALSLSFLVVLNSVEPSAELLRCAPRGKAPQKEFSKGLSFLLAFRSSIAHAGVDLERVAAAETQHTKQQLLPGGVI